MEKDNIILQKSFEFAVEAVLLCKKLQEDKKEYTLSKQLLRCATSIGANAEEAIGGQSKADFISKFSIAYKEARETRYWLRLLLATDYIDTTTYEKQYKSADELCRIISAILISSKK
jgi:four helix bundle protein